jgi:hypothetical protein
MSPLRETVISRPSILLGDGFCQQHVQGLPLLTLKARLLEAHMLQDQEKLDILFKTEPLGDCKPSQLLAY